MSDFDKLNKIKDWRDWNNEKCPIINCKGKILLSDETFISKCSDCGKFFILVDRWEEVKK